MNEWKDKPDSVGYWVQATRLYGNSIKPKFRNTWILSTEIHHVTAKYLPYYTAKPNDKLWLKLDIQLPNIAVFKLPKKRCDK